jgi:predicted DNA-binding transcriptional regulator AlpA
MMLPINLPGPRIWGPAELAEFFGFSIHWVYKITKKKAKDPPPRCRGLGRLRFDTQSREFQEWIERQMVGSCAIDTESLQRV